MHLDVVVGKSLLAAHSYEARIECQTDNHDGCYDGVLFRVGYSKPSKLQRMVVVEAHHQEDIDGHKPHKTRHSIEDSAQAALLARHASQLTVGAVEDICLAEQQDADDVHQ